MHGLMFHVHLIVCLPERSALALQEPQKPRKMSVFAIFSGLRRTVTYCNGSREPVLGAEGLILLTQNPPPEGSFS